MSRYWRRNVSVTCFFEEDRLGSRCGGKQERSYMWITQPITTRIFVWFAAITIPFQSLPAATCGCNRVVLDAHEAVEIASCCATGAEACLCDESSPCCQPELACCSVGSASKSASESASGCSCQCGIGCQCGDNCQCDKGSRPTEPTAPPTENSSFERIAADSTAAASFVSFYLPSTTHQRSGFCASSHALTSLDYCVALCRFTL